VGADTLREKDSNINRTNLNFLRMRLIEKAIFAQISISLFFFCPAPVYLRACSIYQIYDLTRCK
jgi:hypothetical protein